MNPERQAFIAAIREAPDDDAPRLIFADWLDEHGEPGRAEFIRVQCALAALNQKHYLECTSTIVRCMETSDLRRRERELLNWHRNKWTDGWGTYPTRHLEFRRGFVHSITCPAAAWFTDGMVIIAEHPIREVTISDGVLGIRRAGLVSADFKRRWPGVKFHLPGPVYPDLWPHLDLWPQQIGAISALISRPTGLQLAHVDQQTAEEMPPGT